MCKIDFHMYVRICSYSSYVATVRTGVHYDMVYVYVCVCLMLRTQIFKILYLQAIPHVITCPRQLKRNFPK